MSLVDNKNDQRVTLGTSFPSVTFPSELQDGSTLGSVVRKELEQLCAQLQGFLEAAGFNADGTFNNITAQSLTLVNNYNTTLPPGTGQTQTPGTIVIVGGGGATGTGSPGGADTNVQFNQAGTFGGESGLVWRYQNTANAALGVPAAPTVTNTGAGAYAATARHYYIQFLTIASGIVTAISELSLGQPFTPSGTGTAARVAKPSSGVATHWRVYGSADSGVTKYNLSGDIAVGTTTYDDSVAPASYSGVGNGSASPAGTYSGDSQLAVTAPNDEFVSSLQTWKSSTGCVSINPFSSDYLDMLFGAEIVNGQYIARSDVLGYLYQFTGGVNDGGLGIEVYPGQTPGAEIDWTAPTTGMIYVKTPTFQVDGRVYCLGIDSDDDTVGANELFRVESTQGSKVGLIFRMATSGNLATVVKDSSDVTVMSITADTGIITSPAMQLSSSTYANRPSSPSGGMICCISDSNTNTWGATIAGGGANVVLAFYNGANWTVAGK